jgi:NOL1/NOP2/sun family putative RNA methylase
MPFERYREIIPDWNRFIDASSRPEPTTIRVRTGRIESDRLLARLERQGYRLAPLDGQPDFFRVESGPRSIAQTFEHWLGLLYVQRASTGLAAPILAPRPGERVLDLCAAPGGKTTHLADLMEDRGPLVAVEPHEGRIRALAGNVYRTAHVNVLTVEADGRFFPGGALFDRVLVDAPCSAEGTVRAGQGRVRPMREGYRDYIVRLQEDLLRRAIDLTRPGGSVLYSTCTFAPEENEAVVDAVLRDAPVKIEPIMLDVPSAAGLTSFGDRQFDSHLEQAVRVYPHHLDSGGLFLAKLRKTDRPEGASEPDLDAGWSPVPPILVADASAGGERARDEERLDAVRAALADVWQVDSRGLQGVDWLLRGDHAWVHGCGEWPFEAWAGHRGWKSVSVGLRGFGFDTGDLPRPTNDLLRWLGGYLAGRGVDLPAEQWQQLLRREPVKVAGISDGYVALRLSGLPAGRGFVRAGQVRHEIPGVHARLLHRILETEEDTGSHSGV